MLFDAAMHPNTATATKANAEERFHHKQSMNWRVDHACANVLRVLSDMSFAPVFDALISYEMLPPTRSSQRIMKLI
jgi:hypothetical protein